MTKTEIFPAPLPELEDYAVAKFPIPGKCPKPALANGWHRAGYVPVLSLLDGGQPGDCAMAFCLECGLPFPERRVFLLRAQPRELTSSND